MYFNIVKKAVRNQTLTLFSPMIGANVKRIYMSFYFLLFGMDVFQIGGVAFRGSFVWCEDGGKLGWGGGGGYRGGSTSDFSI